jgi:tetratricopeptide (TPR) repeat protein
MARALRNDRLTPADDLRSLLADSEKLLVNLRGSGSNALDLLRDLDTIDALRSELDAAGADLRAEEGRWESVLAGVRDKASQIVREARHLGGLAALRRQNHPDGQAAWWWRLDQEVAARTRRRLLRGGAIALGAIVLIAAAGLILRTLFPVDPRVQQATEKLLQGQNKVEFDGDLQGALVLFQQAAALTPGDSETWLWLGGVQEKLGDAAAAADSFRHASDLIPDPLDYLTRRATIHLALGMLDQALSDANAALARDPENPQAEIILAGVYQAQGQLDAAVQALQRTADYADKRNLPQISATARYQLGMLLQSIPLAPPPSTPPATP